MNKKVVKISEQDIGNIVNEVINKITNNDDWIDISQLDKESLEKAKFDLRLVPYITTFDDIIGCPFLPKQFLMESVKDSLPPDEVVRKIINKYGLNSKLVKKIERCNKVCVYVVTAAVGENQKLIENDMELMGYYLGCYGKEYIIDGVKFIQMQFEPYCQLQKDETENIKNNYDILYHWTPEYNMASILKQGLLPLHENPIFNYPPRTYLVKGDCDTNYLLRFGNALCISNNNKNNNGSYVLLGIDIRNIDGSIRFYYDPNFEHGVFTEQPIPKETLSVVSKNAFQTDLKK